MLLNINRKTVARRLPFLGDQAQVKQKKILKRKPKAKSIQFDDLITIEHTKCKPVAVTIVVDTESRFILGYTVSRIPASGHLAAISKEKYGKRKDERLKNIADLFKNISPNVEKNAHIISDQHPYYPPLVKKYFPSAKYERVKGRKACVAGQGELKKGGYDPLFALNHTCAMFRANINRLIRKSWCTTKDLRALADHIAIYVDYHNSVLLQDY